jgi:alkylated DNA repair dioxygenase AlkB
VREIVPGIGFVASLPDADSLLARILGEVDVSPELITVGNDVVETPRSTAWYGDAGVTYTYSGLKRFPKPWTPTLATLRDRLDADLAIALNSCLVGVYEDGERSVDWHADDEPELRDRIVSISLGGSRRFLLRSEPCGSALELTLTHGSVLVMSVASQLAWQHAVPPQPDAAKRVNLTFRVIADA